jgi:uncharacterized protein YmfQ (DUF2313 family)
MIEPPADTWVQRTAAEYAQAFMALLPAGPAWPREPDRVLHSFISGLAGIWGDPVERLAALLLTQESDPRSTVVLLPDWEEAFGLPDSCAPVPTSIGERQQALVAKMTLLGGQSRAFFIAAAAAIGYQISIREFSPFMCGVSRCGDTRWLDAEDGGDGTHYRWELGSPDMRFYWTVSVDSMRVTNFHCGLGQTGVTPLLGFSLPADLECMLTRLKPAHTDLIFDYTHMGEENFTYANFPFIPILSG